MILSDYLKKPFSFTKYRVALNFCGSLILRMGDFLCFAGTNWDWEKTGFSCWKLIFAIFRKLPFIWNYNILDF